MQHLWISICWAYSAIGIAEMIRVILGFGSWFDCRRVGNSLQCQWGNYRESGIMVFRPGTNNWGASAKISNSVTEFHVAVGRKVTCYRAFTLWLAKLIRIGHDCLVKCNKVCAVASEIEAKNEEEEEEFLSRPSAPAAILSSFESTYVLSNPFPSKPSLVFRNHSTVNLNILHGDEVFLVFILSNLVDCVPRCKQKQGSGWTALWICWLVHVFFTHRWFFWPITSWQDVFCLHKRWHGVA